MNTSFAQQPLTDAFHWAWTTSWQSCALILLVLSIQAVAGTKLPVRWRYLLSFLVLVRLLIPAVPASSLSLQNVTPQIRESRPHQQLQPEWVSPAVLPAETVQKSSRDERHLGDRPDPSNALASIWGMGVAGLMALALIRQFRFARWLSRQPELADGFEKNLLVRCQSEMGVTVPVRLVLAEDWRVPALFGYFRPQLILPAATASTLSGDELRLVFLHELAHVRRRDILLNWLMITARALHWFNPLVWMALRRLRADSELVCDDVVLQQLSDEERPLYGHTLVKLLQEASGIRLCPSLVPAVNHKQEMKRRVIMISEFKPTRRIAVLLSAGLILVLVCVTFTRAMEKEKPVSKDEEMARAKDRANAQRHTEKLKLAEYLENEYRRSRDAVRAAQEEVDQLRVEMKVTEPNGSSDSDPEILRQIIERERVGVETKLVEMTTLLDELERQRGDDLLHTIATVTPDRFLTDLQARRSAIGQLSASTVTNFGSDHPTMMKLKAEEQHIDEEIQKRMAGLVRGLKTQVATLEKRNEKLRSMAEEMKQQDLKAASRYRPYFEKKRELENLKKLCDSIHLRSLQARLVADMPPELEE